MYGAIVRYPVVATFSCCGCWDAAGFGVLDMYVSPSGSPYSAEV
jgi:hypothetical protein